MDHPFYLKTKFLVANLTCLLINHSHMISLSKYDQPIKT